jgi:hypothetical protein
MAAVTARLPRRRRAGRPRLLTVRAAELIARPTSSSTTA